MTVAELIDHLQTLPQEQELECVGDIYSSYPQSPLMIGWRYPVNNFRPGIRLISSGYAMIDLLITTK